MSQEPLLLTYNQLKSYLSNARTTFQNQINTRDWPSAKQTLTNTKAEVDLFISQNPSHRTVSGGLEGNAPAHELSDGITDLSNQVDSIVEYRTNNETATDFQANYNYYVQRLYDSLELLVSRLT